MRKKVHMCMSVDIDRYDDKVLKRDYLPYLSHAGEKLKSVEQLREMCREARARGYEAFPPCDNFTPTGHCAGHSYLEGTTAKAECDNCGRLLYSTPASCPDCAVAA